MAVGKGSILRAGNANAATKEKKTALKESVPVLEENVPMVQMVKETDMAAKVPVEALKSVPKTWGIPALDDGQIEKLAQSMKSLGMIVPVVVYKNKKQELQILKGYHRVEAAKAAGLNEIPVSFVEADSDSKAKLIYEELRAFDLALTKNMDKEYEVVSSITVNMPSYLL